MSRSISIGGLWKAGSKQANGVLKCRGILYHKRLAVLHHIGTNLQEKKQCRLLTIKENQWMMSFLSQLLEQWQEEKVLKKDPWSWNKARSHLLHSQLHFIPLIHSVSFCLIILQLKLAKSIWATKPGEKAQALALVAKIGK